MKKALLLPSTFLLLLSLCLTYSFGQQKEKTKETLEPDKIPTIVINSLKAKFPKAEIHKWTKEKEDNIVIYDIEFMQEAKNYAADIKENGTIYNWEKEIAENDLPATVRQAVDTKYPKCTLKEIMQVTAVKDGKDELEGYEIIIETEDNNETEITLSPDGTLM
ncbi:MAG: hypothetical protein A2Y62_02035 [Candidatus Fischerbacteria bacterium RBG_13_37_8]|uniref:Uncharacterized protein n=1 Tax=Candidatus Fischerbacteria bacterium RBG_13_37_8 TaxID=1817863 RepID=A0A1F5VJL0_9BACT|nr:MAG: hypothetical protein A2Y62_02035 [Candidatus Fischerbacteria bacterium RBG_13_37_8]